jgi:transposase
VNAELFSLALENFAREVRVGTRRRILLVVDRAGWHTAKKLKIPEVIHLEFLPSHSPELQPSERLWPLSNEGLANRHFEEIEEMEEVLVDRCVALSDQPELIRSYIRYHWWLNAA